MRTYVCSRCAAAYPLDAVVWRCTCGGLLDLSPIPPVPPVVDSGEWSLWRYRSTLPFESPPFESPPCDTVDTTERWRSVSLGEGMTPLVRDQPGTGGTDVLLKLDFLMPTLSYKDRGAAVLVAKAAEIGVRRLVADSSGNAGTAIAAYAARAGIAAEVFVPATTSAKKVAQLRALGATVRQINGTRTDAADAAVGQVEATGSFYASHVYNPLFLQGTKTFAYEIWEQLGRRAPSAVVVPAGNGTLLLGAAIGFGELVAAGAATEIPRLVAVQARRCAPVAAAWEGRHLDPREWVSTVAEGIAIPQPPRLEQMVAAVQRCGGRFLTVTDEQITHARRRLAGRGIDVEPTAAAVWAAEPADTAGPGTVVVALTGAGLKSAA